MRCFVALVPARSLVDRVAGWGAETFAPLPWARSLPPQSLHVTLAFLGELDHGAVGRAGEIVSAVAPERTELRLEPELVPVPRRRPRVLALTAAGDRIAPLQAELAAALAGTNLLERDRRPFWPHLSVARVKRGALDGGRGRAAIEALPRLTGEAAAPRPASRLVLYRSELGPERATYTALAEIALPGE